MNANVLLEPSLPAAVPSVPGNFYDEHAVLFWGCVVVGVILLGATIFYLGKWILAWNDRSSRHFVAPPPTSATSIAKPVTALAAGAEAVTENSHVTVEIKPRGNGVMEAKFLTTASTVPGRPSPNALPVINVLELEWDTPLGIEVFLSTGMDYLKHLVLARVLEVVNSFFVNAEVGQAYLRKDGVVLFGPAPTNEKLKKLKLRLMPDIQTVTALGHLFALRRRSSELADAMTLLGLENSVSQETVLIPVRIKRGGSLRKDTLVVSTDPRSEVRFILLSARDAHEASLVPPATATAPEASPAVPAGPVKVLAA